MINPSRPSSPSAAWKVGAVRSTWPALTAVIINMRRMTAMIPGNRKNKRAFWPNGKVAKELRGVNYVNQRSENGRCSLW